jgi:hypothetical protein
MSKFIQIGVSVWIKADDICYIGRERKENGRLVVMLSAGSDADYCVEKEYEQEVLSLIERLDALEGKGAVEKPGTSGRWIKLPSGNDNTDVTTWSLGEIVKELVAIGAGYSSYEQANLASELVRRLAEAAKIPSDFVHVAELDREQKSVLNLKMRIADLEAYIAKHIKPTTERFYGDGINEYTKPAPEPTSETTVPELYTRHHERIGQGVWACENETWQPATTADVEAAARDMGLLDAERQKVAEAFLEAAQDGDRVEVVAYVLNSIADGMFTLARSSWLRRMASVLEAAAKGEQ